MKCFGGEVVSLFSERLKELRKAKGVTQKSMAEQLRVTERHYQRYESAAIEPNHETTIKLADLFGVSVDYLLGRTNYWIDSGANVKDKVSADILNLDTYSVKSQY